MTYAVLIEIDIGEWDYVRTSYPSNPSLTPVATFDTPEAAQAEADTWNTGTVVPYSDDP